MSEWISLDLIIWWWMKNSFEYFCSYSAEPKHYIFKNFKVLPLLLMNCLTKEFYNFFSKGLRKFCHQNFWPSKIFVKILSIYFSLVIFTFYKLLVIMLSLLVSNLYWMRWRTVHCTLYSFQWAVYTWGIYWRYLEKGKPCQKLKLDSNLYDKQGIRKISSSLKTRRLFVVTWFPWGWELPLSPHPDQCLLLTLNHPLTNTQESLLSLIAW